ncbi:metal-dependent hydrolase family protein [Tunturibacter empetritectus]|uniref:Imidazolonepropionase-like amidohydrolase n=1 Tax=Tunturiibacter empetritectus TaxID=3069691 RepID=A0A7W8IK27_9BACT|nr:amidohydrolase family protein [Edaphobacter lichenicola]MBB5318514.1 imidazolonepropionase-like amidohydrolase [Edaphobacter lichenicola]
MRQARHVKLYLFLFLLQIAFLNLHAQTTPRTLVRTGHLLEVKTGAEPAAQTIIVTGDRITAIAPTASTPKQAGDTEIDLTRFTVMPGLIDVHTHLTAANNFDPYFELSMTPAKEAIIGVENAKVTLEAGFTTVRNVGANDFTDVALRDEINAGHIPGPHMQVSGPALGITGGHMDENLLPYEFHYHAEGVADGIPAVQHQVRENIKYGADLIKIGATGGVLSKGDDPQASQYTLEEMQAIVADAHRLGRKVAAHAHGAQGILFATEAGVDSIEHGSYINDEDIALMKKKGTYLVPTAYLVDWMQQYGNLPPFYQQKMKDVSAVEKQNAIKAIKAGVKIALGTDAAVYPHGLNAHEVDVYVNQFGMSPLQGIQTGTLNAADLMGWNDRVGSIDPGKWADLIAIDGDPLKDVKLLQHVPFVMKSGIVYKDETHK